MLEEFGRIYNCKTAYIEKDGFGVSIIEGKTVDVFDGVGSFSALDTLAPDNWDEKSLQSVVGQAIAEYRYFMKTGFTPE